MSDRHWSHDWHGFDDDEDRSEFMCHYCEICTCHSPEKSAGACERLVEVERAAAEKALVEFADNYERAARHAKGERAESDPEPGYWVGADDVVEHVTASLRTKAKTYRRNEGENDGQILDR